MLLQIIFLTLISMILYTFLIYPTLMGHASKRTQNKPKQNNYLPFISIIIPTYNEESYIQKKLENLRNLDYPKNLYEVIIVDSASGDRFKEIVNKFIEKEKSGLAITLISEDSRRGLSVAINEGMKHSKGEIVCTNAAHAFVKTDFLKNIARYFENPEVGGVTGRFIPDNSEYSPWSYYWEYERLTRDGESVYDSVSVCQTETHCWRKPLAAPDPDVISDDLDIPLKIKRKGYRVIFAADAECVEQLPSNPREILKQRRRNVVGTLQVISRHLSWMTKTASMFTSFIFPSHRILPLLTPFIFLAIIAESAYFMLINDYLTLLYAVILFVPIIIVLLWLLSKLLIESPISRRANGGLMGLCKTAWKFLFFFTLVQVSILLGWFDFASGKYKVAWDKIIVE
jgi:biofilm PGA synthesis N-glycosyltransferase PgaC